MKSQPVRRHHNKEAAQRIKNGGHLKPLHRIAAALGVKVVVGKPKKKEK